MRIKKDVTVKTKPLIRLRFMLIGLVLLALAISGPLLVVRKQVYITDVSMKMNALSDSLNMLNKEIATLQLTAEQLSANGRIEEFARTARNLEYPSVNQIVIVKMKHGENRNDSVTVASVIGVINKSLGVRN